MSARAWREPQHPRRPAGPGGGQFISKGGAVGWLLRTGASAGGQRPARGHDIRDQLDYDKLARRIHQDNSGAGDVGLGDIYEVQGFDGRPLVVSKDEMDQLVASGHTQVFRGVADARDDSPFAGLTGTDFAHQFRVGDQHWPGYGMHGNGSYATSWELEARGYSDATYEKFRTDPGEPEDWPGVLRIAVPPDARVVELGRLRSQWAQETAQHRGAERRAVFADMGRFAAALGYDAIDLGPMSTAGTQIPGAPPSRTHYVLLNRSILAVQEAY